MAEENAAPVDSEIDKDLESIYEINKFNTRNELVVCKNNAHIKYRNIETEKLKQKMKRIKSEIAKEDVEEIRLSSEVKATDATIKSLRQIVQTQEDSLVDLELLERKLEEDRKMWQIKFGDVITFHSNAYLELRKEKEKDPLFNKLKTAQMQTLKLNVQNLFLEEQINDTVLAKKQFTDIQRQIFNSKIVDFTRTVLEYQKQRDTLRKINELENKEIVLMQRHKELKAKAKKGVEEQLTMRQNEAGPSRLVHDREEFKYADGNFLDASFFNDDISDDIILLDDQDNFNTLMKDLKRKPSVTFGQLPQKTKSPKQRKVQILDVRKFFNAKLLSQQSFTKNNSMEMKTKEERAMKRPSQEEPKQKIATVVEPQKVLPLPKVDLGVKVQQLNVRAPKSNEVVKQNCETKEIQASDEKKCSQMAEHEQQHQNEVCNENLKTFEDVSHKYSSQAQEVNVPTPEEMPLSINYGEQSTNDETNVNATNNYMEMPTETSEYFLPNISPENTFMDVDGSSPPRYSGLFGQPTANNEGTGFSFGQSKNLNQNDVFSLF